MKFLSHDKLVGLELFLFLLFVTLFGWPIMTIVDRTHNATIFVYLFLMWGLAILLIGLISLNLKSASTGQDKKEGPSVS